MIGIYSSSILSFIKAKKTFEIMNCKKYEPSNKEASYDNVLQAMRGIAKEIGYTNRLTHTSLKSGGVTRCFEKGLNESQVRDLGGWHSSQTTLIYKRRNIRQKAKDAKVFLSKN